MVTLLELPISYHFPIGKTCSLNDAIKMRNLFFSSKLTMKTSKSSIIIYVSQGPK